MRRYLLDTAPLAAYLNNRQGAVALIQQWIRARESATSVLVYAEVLEYVYALPNLPQRRAQLRRLLRAVYPYSLTYAVLDRYAQIRRALRPPHGPGLIGDIDTLIAATALERDLTVVTIDSDFQRVPNLRVRPLTRSQLRR
jgi:predicted nucleic acid-binding protein